MSAEACSIISRGVSRTMGVRPRSRMAAVISWTVRLLLFSRSVRASEGNVDASARNTSARSTTRSHGKAIERPQRAA